jgi:hypothetical protein
MLDPVFQVGGRIRQLAGDNNAAADSRQVGVPLFEDLRRTKSAPDELKGTW